VDQIKDGKTIGTYYFTALIFDLFYQELVLD